MPDLDEYLRSELNRMVKPVDVNAVASRIDMRRTRKAFVRKAQSLALTVIVLAGTIGLVTVMSIEFRDTGTQPIAAKPALASEDIGFGFPVCDVTTSVGNWGGHGTVMYLATKANDAGGCPAPDDGVSQVFGLDEDGNGKVDINLGAVQCLGSCRFLAAPDIDQDGTQELAIAEGVNGSSGSIRIYSVNTDGEPSLVPWQDNGNDLVFAWDTSNDHQAGAFCDEGSDGPEFVVWNAERIGPGHYRETQFRYHLAGTTAEVGLARPRMTTFEVPDDKPLLPGLDSLCGKTFNNTWGTG